MKLWSKPVLVDANGEPYYWTRISTPIGDYSIEWSYGDDDYKLYLGDDLVKEYPPETELESIHEYVKSLVVEKYFKIQLFLEELGHFSQYFEPWED